MGFELAAVATDFLGTSDQADADAVDFEGGLDRAIADYELRSVTRGGLESLVPATNATRVR